MPDGSFERIGIEQALDEIAERLSAVIERDGPEAVGGYRGTGSGFNAVGCFIMDTLFEQIGTKKIFSASTIDQTAKNVAVERIGYWQAGLHHVIGSDVTLLIGTNPLVSFALTFIVINPLKHLKQEKARGMKLLVVDPRVTETAKFADIHLQPVPGEDAAILAGMIRQILKNGWEDKAFVERYVDGLEELRARVEPFTPDYVASRAGIDEAAFLGMTRIFATARSGKAMTGTGANMGPHSNLVEAPAQLPQHPVRAPRARGRADRFSRRTDAGLSAARAGRPGHAFVRNQLQEPDRRLQPDPGDRSRTANRDHGRRDPPARPRTGARLLRARRQPRRDRPRPGEDGQSVPLARADGGDRPLHDSDRKTCRLCPADTATV